MNEPYTTLQKQLEELYGSEQSIKLTKLVEQKVSALKSSDTAEPYKLSEKDVILITYGDQVQKENQSHLKSFLEFYQVYIKEIINTVHFLPFFPYSSDDGFSVINFREIDPNLGTWDDVTAIRKECRLMFDAVVNHISSQSEWFQHYLKKEDYEDYFHNLDPKTDVSEVVRPRTHPLLTPFKRGDETAYIWTTFSEDQIDLNFSSPALFVEMLDILFLYVTKGADLLRLDAIAFLWKEIGTNCLHHEKTHLWVQIVKTILREIRKNTLIITETNVPHNENVSYLKKEEADLVYNFTLPPLLAHSVLTENTNTLQTWAESLSLPSEDVCFFNFTASHDGVGVRPVQGILTIEEIDNLAQTAKNHGGNVSFKDNGDGSQSPYELNCNYFELLSHPDEEEQLRVQKFLCTQSALLAMPGVPGIYFHSLFGSLNAHEEVQKTGRLRSINRKKLPISVIVNELETEDSLRSKVYSQYQSMLNQRKRLDFFNPFGKFSFPKFNDSIFTIERKNTTTKESLFATHNFSSQPSSIQSYGAGSFTDILTNKPITELKPFQYCWLVKK